MKIVALDFETANRYPQSACALGVAVYEDGEIKDSFEWYFRPFERYNFFTNSYINNIYKEDVADCEDFSYYYEELGRVVDDAVIIAHNAAFDIGVLNALCDYFRLPRFTNPYLDTVRLARIHYPMTPNHRLYTMAKYLGIELNHHNGQSDAYACLMIMLNIINDCELYEDDDFIREFQKLMKHNH